MRQKHTLFITVGIPSLFLIFSVLCLCVLALLTMGSSRSSLNTARYSMEQTEKYYNACSKATETVSEIRSELSKLADSASDEAEYFSLIQTSADSWKNISWDSTKHTLTFSTEISDTQQLCTVLEIFYPSENNGSILEIRQWDTDLTSSWEPDTHQNIFKGE